MGKIAVIGAGSMGTAMAVCQAAAGRKVVLWDRKPDMLDNIKETGENARYLPGVKVPGSVTLCADEAEALEGAGFVLFAVPSQHFRGVLTRMAPHISSGAVIVNTAKGVEQGSLLRLSEVAAELMPGRPYAVLSGPSHAEEIGRLMPTVVTASSADPQVARLVRQQFITDTFRIYLNDDLTGVELGGALKNIIALASGVAEGLGFGDNARAALMTRGMVEMARLGVAMGAKSDTFFGLSGAGDLIVTCTSQHSRNHRCGILIGQGMAPDEAAAQIGMVVEGIAAANAAYALSQKYAVRMPITSGLHLILHEKFDPMEAGALLMSRGREYESEDLFRAR